MKQRLLLIAAIILCIAAVAQTPLDGLVHHFTFDSSGFNEASTTGFNVSLFDSDRHGIAGRAVYLNNSQVSENVPNTPVGNSARTFSVWVKTNFLNEPVHVFAYGAPDFTTYGLSISQNQLTNVANGESLTYSEEENFLQENEWNHIVLTHTETTSHIYLNGALVATETRTLDTDGTQFYIGGNGSEGQNFQGYLDDLLIYNRALSQSEITALYNCSLSAPPVFNPIGSVCPNTPFTLPTTSVNGITGTWSPAANASATTTYTFTPDAGQCGAATATMTVEVGRLALPVVTSPAEDRTICPGTSATLTAWGVGTVQWMDAPRTNTVLHTGDSYTTPALHGTTTYYVRQYTGNPQTGCYSTVTPVTVTINGVTSVFEQLTVCEGEESPLPTTSANGITGSWSPVWNAYLPATYTFTPDAGQCAATAMMTVKLQRNVTPVFRQVPPICPGGTLVSLPTISADGMEGTWSPALNNTETTTYTFTPNIQCGAAPLATMIIAVNAPDVEPAFTIQNSLCYGAASPLPAVSNNGIAGTWAPEWNATQSRNYTFTPDQGQCGVTTSTSVTINTSVTGPSLPQNTTPAANLAVCQGVATTLSVAQAVGITVQWFDSPGSSAVIHTGHSFPTTALYTTTTYYVRRFTSGGCYTPRIPITVIVIPEGSTPEFDQIEPICQGGTFVLPVTSLNGITGTWSPAVNNTQTTEYIFTPGAGQCGATTVTMTVEVNPPTIIPDFEQIAPVCPGASNPLGHTSTNGIRGTWSPVWNSSTETTYTFTPNAGQCAITTTMTIAPVEPLVITTPVEDLTICFATSTTITVSGGGTIQWFNHPSIGTMLHTGSTFTTSVLGQNTTYYVRQCNAARIPVEVKVNQLASPEFAQAAPTCAGTALSSLPVTSDNGIAGSWALTANNGATETYTFTPNAGECAATATMIVTVTPSTMPVFTQIAPICQGAALAALPGTSSNGVTGTWSPALNNSETTEYTFTPEGGGACILQATMTITVIPAGITPDFAPIAPICAGASLSLPAISDNGIGGTWSPAVNNTITTSYIFMPSAGQCGATTANMTVSVLPVGASTDTRTEEAPFTWIDGQTYTASNNTATYILQSENGCDSVVTLNLTIDTSNDIQLTHQIVSGGNCPDVEISVSNAVFPVTLRITWVGNTNPLTTTIYAPSHIYTEVCAGNYTLLATDANGRSATINFNPLTVGIDRMLAVMNAVSVYPNPASSVATLESVPAESTITLFDLTGKAVYTTVSSATITSIETDMFIDGVYYIQISNPVYGAVTKKLIISK